MSDVITLSNGKLMQKEHYDLAIKAGQAWAKRDASLFTYVVNQLLHAELPVDNITNVASTQVKSQAAEKIKLRKAVVDLALQVKAARDQATTELRLNAKLAANQYARHNVTHDSQALINATNALTAAWVAALKLNQGALTAAKAQVLINSIVQVGADYLKTSEAILVDSFSTYALDVLTKAAHAALLAAVTPYGADSDYYGKDEDEDEPLHMRMIKTPLGLTAIGLTLMFGYLIYKESHK